MQKLNRKVNTEENQSLFDLSLQEYGSIEGLFLLLEDNNINSVNTNLAGGTSIDIKQEAIEQNVVDYYKKNKKSVNGSFVPTTTTIPAPTIASISFTPLVTSQTKNIVIIGTNFTSGTTVTIAKGGNTITVNSVTFDSSTQLTVNITTGTITGGFDVTINNGASATEVDGITVAQATPTIASISFTPLVTSQTKNIVITGTNFTSGTTVTIAKGGNTITVNSETFDSSTQLTVNITTGTVTGGFDVTVNNGSSVTEVDGISVNSGTIVLTPGDSTTNWIQVTGSTVIGLSKAENDKPATGGWGNMVSFGSIPTNKDGFVEFNFIHLGASGNAGYSMGGLSLSSGGTNYNDIEYKFYQERPTNRISVFNGSRQNAATNFSLTDTFKVERTINSGVGTVKFYRNGVLFYTHPTTTTAELFIKFDFNEYIGVNNVTAEHN